MSLTILTQASSLNPGADLWVIPALPVSRSAQKIDWHLNLQLSKSTLHQTKSLDNKLKSILNKCELPESRFTQSPDRLLVSTALLLPNRWVLQLSGSSEFPKWCGSIAEVWTSLRKPTLRVFLPTGLSAASFQKSWKEKYSFDDFSVVVD